ncbi:MAG: ABC transporter permease [Defluviitaleaceae bacterium]|nr:ABC transporter permease [Defluviitaleaceae bacterium]
MLSQIVAYFQNYSHVWAHAVGAHIRISLLSFSIAMLVGIPAGVFCVYVKWTRRYIVPFFQMLRVVPSVAILLLLLPIMGTGIRPAMTALAVLSIPAILINTVAGLENVPDFMLETAAACGMTKRQLWTKVRLPLALPLITTGCKTAIIEIIASATIAAQIGAGGLGELIFTGLGLNRYDILLVGGMSVALLSLCAALVIGLFDKIVLRYK